MNWVSISPEQIGGILVTTFFVYFGLMLIIRINGLRSFSKMSGHDFAVTVAIGSVFASTVIAREPSLLQGLLAISAMLGIQSIFSYWRLRRSEPHLENQPLLLMDGPDILEANLRRAKMTRADLYAKLREANVLRLEDVRAAVLEQTGDVSVLHGSKTVESELLEDVRR